MPAAPATLVIELGATLAATAVITNLSTGLPLDLTGASGRCQIRRRVNNALLAAGDGSNPADFDSNTGGLTFGGTNGQFTLNATDTVTSNWVWYNDFVFDLFALLASGQNIRVTAGPVDVIQNITTPTRA